MPARPLKHLLLDFGGPVLLTPFELVDKAAETLGPLSWRGPFDTSTDPEYVSWQSGQITEREYWLIRGEPYGLDLPGLMRHFYEPPGDYLVRPEMADLILRQRAAGRAVGMLTNDLNAFHERGVEGGHLGDRPIRFHRRRLCYRLPEARSARVSPRPRGLRQSRARGRGVRR